MKFQLVDLPCLKRQLVRVYSPLSLSRKPSISNFSLSRTKVSFPFAQPITYISLSISNSLYLEQILWYLVNSRQRESTVHAYARAINRCNQRCQNKHCKYYNYSFIGRKLRGQKNVQICDFSDVPKFHAKELVVQTICKILYLKNFQSLVNA